MNGAWVWFMWSCSTGSTSMETLAVAVDLAFSDGAVIDPKLSDGETIAVGWALEGNEVDDCGVEIELSNPYEQRVSMASEAETSGSFEWDGYDDKGSPFDPGPVTAIATATCANGTVGSGSADAFVVRLGVTEIDFVDAADGAGNVTLAYHKLNLVDFTVTPIHEGIPEYFAGVVSDTALADLDDDEGVARTVVEPWTNPDVPPWAGDIPGTSQHNIPVGYVAESTVRVHATMGETAVSPTRGVAIDALGAEEWAVLRPSLRLVPEGFDAVDGGETVTPGEEMVLDGALIDLGLGVHEMSIVWRWDAKLPGGEWQSVPGGQTTTHTLYVLAGQPVLLDGTEVGAAADLPWIGVLDDLAPAVQGLSADSDAVLDAVRDYLYDNSWLVYDPSDSAYTEYDGEYIFWESIEADLSGWLDREDGINLYCHSMSCLLSTLVGTLGVGAPQQVLGVGFRTNYGRAAGTDESDTWSFNSHSVVSPDDGATIWDASIDLDGDDDPSSQPIDPLSPKGLSGDEYFWRLTFDDIEIVNRGYCFIQ